MNLFVFALIPGILSSLSSAFIILLYLFNKKIRNAEISKFVFILQVFDFSVSVAQLIPSIVFSSSPFLCVLQGILIQFFNMGEILWTGYITYVLFSIIVLKKRDKSQQPIMLPLIFTMLTCLITALIPLAFDGYKDSIGICFLQANSHINTFFARFCLNYIFMWTINIWNAFAYKKIIERIKRYTGNSNGSYALVNKLKYYPLSIFVCEIQISVLMCLDSFGIPLNIYYFLFAVCCARAFGLCNSLCFGFTKEVKNVLLCKKSSEIKENGETSMKKISRGLFS